MSGELLLQKDNQICTITLNRPQKRNSLTPGMLLELSKELERLKGEEKIRCVIIRGAGNRAFSAGYDIMAIGKDIEDDMMRDYIEDHPLTVVSKAIESFPYPILAMINGYAFGAGLELAVTCDLRIAVEDAVFGMPPAKLGVTYSYIGIRKFINLIGIGYTKELFLLGKNIDAKRAEKIGLVNYVVPRERLEDLTYEIASEICENAPLSMTTMKEIINGWQRNQVLNAEDEERIKQMIKIVQESKDYKEGKKAFFEKRKPKFEGK